MQFSDFDVNPKIEDSERGVALAIEAGVDLIVGVGVGSVMDMAKLIKAFFTAPEKSKELARGELAMTDPGILRIVLDFDKHICGVQHTTLALTQHTDFHIFIHTVIMVILTF